MTLNLSRSSKLYVSTNDGKDLVGVPFSPADTFEVAILDGFSFTQDTETENITVEEAGDAPTRGQQQFNVSLNPVDYSFQSYVRLYNNGDERTAVEAILWEGLVGEGPAFTNVTLGSLLGATNMEVSVANSDVHELLPLFMYFVMDNVTYRINGATVGTAEVDFAIDSIATISWTGQGLTLEEVPTGKFPAVSGVDYLPAPTGCELINNRLSTLSIENNEDKILASSTADYTAFLECEGPTAFADDGTTYTADITVDGTIYNVEVIGQDVQTVEELLAEINIDLAGAPAQALLINGAIQIVADGIIDGTPDNVIPDVTIADVDLFANVSGGLVITPVAGVKGSVYKIPITGGSLTFENNITYLTPQELGRVNSPCFSYTGTRSITGTVTAYLNTGICGETNAFKTSGDLLNDMLNNASTADQTSFEFLLAMGGATKEPRVEFKIPRAHLVIPSVNVDSVVATEINFTAQGTNISTADEVSVTYVTKP